MNFHCFIFPDANNFHILCTLVKMNKKRHKKYVNSTYRNYTNLYLVRNIIEHTYKFYALILNKK